MIIHYSGVINDYTDHQWHVGHYFLFLKVNGVQTDSNNVTNFLGRRNRFLGTCFKSSIRVLRVSFWHRLILALWAMYAAISKRLITGPLRSTQATLSHGLLWHVPVIGLRAFRSERRMPIPEATSSGNGEAPVISPVCGLLLMKLTRPSVNLRAVSAILHSSVIVRMS